MTLFAIGGTRLASLSLNPIDLPDSRKLVVGHWSFVGRDRPFDNLRVAANGRQP